MSQTSHSNIAFHSALFSSTILTTCLTEEKAIFSAAIKAAKASLSFHFVVSSIAERWE